MTGNGDVFWRCSRMQDLSAEKLYDILRLRSEIFVVEQNCPYLDLDGDDGQALHLWAEKGGEILAYCRIFGAGIKYSEPSIGRVVTAPQARRQSYGKILMKLAVQVIENRFAGPQIRISAQDYLIPFYGEFGFRETGKKYLEDNLPHSEMLRT